MQKHGRGTQESNFIYAGKVRYIDYSTESVPRDNSFSPFLHKRLSFAHEQEVRAMIDVGTLENLHPSMREPPSGEQGVYVPTDLNALIERVHVSPQAPEWFSDLVRRTSEKYGVTAPVTRSSLDQDPVY